MNPLLLLFCFQFGCPGCHEDLSNQPGIEAVDFRGGYSAQGTASQGSKQQDDDQQKKAERKIFAGTWKLDAERTLKELKDKDVANADQLVKTFAQMVLKLGDDGNFEWTVGESTKITGSWKIKIEPDDQEDEAKIVNAELTLDPDNLDDDHEDMLFGVRLTEKKFMKAQPPGVPGTIVFARQSEKKDEEKKDTDKQQ